MAVGPVAGGDPDHLPEEAQLELDQSRGAGGTGGSRCEHGGRSRGSMGRVCGRDIDGKETRLYARLFCVNLASDPFKDATEVNSQHPDQTRRGGFC